MAARAARKLPASTVRRRRTVAASSSAAPQAAKPRVVVTGSTKGLGYALAAAFRDAGCSVVVSGRSAERTADAARELGVAGCAADVCKASEVDALLRHALDVMGGVDLFIANAGTNAYAYTDLLDADAEALAEIVNTNLLGSLLCCAAAGRAMRAQPGGGLVALLEGAGSDGAPTAKFGAYGASKAALRQLAATLQAEWKESNVGILSISPGLVFTELVESGRDAFGSSGRFFVNALAEEPAVVAAAVVPPALAALTARRGAAQRIEVLTPAVAATKLLRRLLLGENKSRHYPE